MPKIPPWTFNGKPFKNSQGFFGFVYVITNLTDGRLYIGKKFFTKAGYKQVNGKRKKIRKTSTWESYFGSSPSLQSDITKLGKSNFQREILHLCKSRSECSYYETLEIFTRDALRQPDKYYNEWVSCRIRRKHLI